MKKMRFYQNNSTALPLRMYSGEVHVPKTKVDFFVQRSDMACELGSKTGTQYNILYRTTITRSNFSCLIRLSTMQFGNNFTLSYLKPVVVY